MENPGSSRSSRSSRSRTAPKKERGASARGHPPSKTGKTAGAAPVGKEKMARGEVAGEPDAGEKVKTTVVDIDRVRDDQVKDQSAGLLEAAQQDGRREHAVHPLSSHLWSFSLSEALV